MKRMNFPGRKDSRRRMADEMHAASSKRSLEERLALIEERPGVSAKEMARLLSPSSRTTDVRDRGDQNEVVPKKRKGNPKGKKGKEARAHE